MWEEPSRNVVEHNMGPLSTLDPMDRGQHHAVDGAWMAQGLPKPFLEPLGIGMERRKRDQRVKVIGLGRAIEAAARALQQLHGPVQSDVIAHRLQNGSSRAR